ncbi:MAG: mechanosensitive ion channel [Leptolyngbyaceae cyanobacterium T60_A2020_046]|nr:mechanosensitive ion channel [Leptolyngbyaceae cyanobacterium T60_A2020_046]
MRIQPHRQHWNRWNRGNCSNRWGRSLAGFISLIALIITLAVPSLAQSDTLPSAPVVVDGRTLFELARTDQITAEERADTIRQELADRVESGDELLVAWELRGSLPVILINGRYLMTVTQADAALSNIEDPAERAAQLTSLLNRELDAAIQERSQEVLARRGVIAIVVLIVTITLYRLVGLLWRRSLRPTVTLITTTADADYPPTGLNLLLNLSLVLVRLCLVFGAITYVTNLFPVTRRWSYFLRQQAINGFIEPNLRLGQSQFSILSLLILFGVLLGVVLAASIFTNFLRSRVLHLAGIDRGSREAIAILVKYTVIFVGVVVVLQIWGLDLSSLALIASALGVGIGLGLQNITKDFGSGIVLVFERPIQVGDFVEFGTFRGTVERIGARSTEIKTLDQISIIVPNSRFLEQEVINWSHRNPVSRLRVPVGVAYSANPEQVRDLLVEISLRHPQVLSTPPPVVFFIGFGDSALNFELLVWIAEPHLQLMIRSDLYFAIEAGLREHSIEIPFPQRDLHVRSGELPLQLSPELQQWLRDQTPHRDRPLT